MRNLEVHDRLQWTGLLVGALVALCAFTSGLSFHGHHLHQLLRLEEDGWGYYQYLPALLGTHRWEHLPWAHILPDANGLSLFTCGVAMLLFPWAVLGHALAWVTGSPLDGYSAPYAVMVLLGSAVYTGIATGLLFHALRRRYSVGAALTVPVLLFTGTNLFFYATRQPTMSHAPVYFLFAVLHYLVVRNRESASPWRSAGILVVLSLAVLVRQLHAVVVLFPLLYGVDDLAGLRARLGWWTRRPWITAVGVGIAAALWVPQLAYWHRVTGRWLIFPYGYKGEHFDHLTDPHLLDVLFNVLNGWWVYTPLMAITCLALVRMAVRNEMGARVVLAITVQVWYGYAAWWCWWLGGAFGHRGFVELYALLAVPLAWLLDRAFTWSLAARIPFALVIALCVLANLRMSAHHTWDWNGPGWTWADYGAEWRGLF